MLIPPLSEQREIEAYLDVVDKRLAQEEQKWSALSSLFDSLLHDLMTGQRRVHELDLDFAAEDAA
jgi:type I restriction enzyme S subunit